MTLAAVYELKAGDQRTERLPIKARGLKLREQSRSRAKNPRELEKTAVERCGREV